MPTPTRQQVEALTVFLPRLYAPDFAPVLKWEGGQKQANGAYTMPYPSYDPLVEEFFDAVRHKGWVDTSYQPESSWQMLKDEAVVRSAGFDQIRQMLTYCVRGERFSDGHWEQMIAQGYIRRLLERLQELQRDLP